MAEVPPIERNNTHLSENELPIHNSKRTKTDNFKGLDGPISNSVVDFTEINKSDGDSLLSGSQTVKNAESISSQRHIKDANILIDPSNEHSGENNHSIDENLAANRDGTSKDNKNPVESTKHNTSKTTRNSEGVAKNDNNDTNDLTESKFEAISSADLPEELANGKSVDTNSDDQEELDDDDDIISISQGLVFPDLSYERSSQLWERAMYILDNLQVEYQQLDNHIEQLQEVTNERLGRARRREQLSQDRKIEP